VAHHSFTLFSSSIQQGLGPIGRRAAEAGEQLEQQPEDVV